MIIKNYVKAKTLKEAYILYQKKNNYLLGGMLWTRLTNKNVDTLIDISKLNLSYINEKRDKFIIGASTTLRDIETHKQLNKYFSNLFNESLKSIVGVQFRNMATIGGSIYQRAGYSDILTALLSCSVKVSLYGENDGKQGEFIVDLKDYIRMPYDRNIIKEIIIFKEEKTYLFERVAISETDFAVLNAAFSIDRKCSLNSLKAVYGSRPEKSFLIDFGDENKKGSYKIGQSGRLDENSIATIVDYISKNIKVTSNLRGSKEYRVRLLKNLSEKNLIKFRSH